MMSGMFFLRGAVVTIFSFYLHITTTKLYLCQLINRRYFYEKIPIYGCLGANCLRLPT
jgi:hypothetical protein